MATRVMLIPMINLFVRVPMANVSTLSYNIKTHHLIIDEVSKRTFESVKVIDEVSRKASGVSMLLQENEFEKPKNVHQPKDNVKESSHPVVSKSSTKRSSRFFSASFFSFKDDEAEFTPSTLFRGIQRNFLKISVGMLLLCGG